MGAFWNSIKGLFGNHISTAGKGNVVMQDINNSTVNVNVSIHNYFLRLEDWLNRYNTKSPFITAPVLEDIISHLRDDSRSAIKMVALSGLGKTRIVYEAFKDHLPEDAYICVKSNDILKDFAALLLDEEQRPKLIILDDCPKDDIQSLINKRDELCPDCRLVFINNDFFNQTNSSDYRKISIDVNDLKEAVYQYIEENVPVNNNDTFFREQIKKLSGGYPFLAVRFVTAFQERRAVLASDAEDLMSKLLGTNNYDELIAMRTMALFQPLGYSDRRAREFDAVALSNIITPLPNLNDEGKRLLFKRLIQRYEGVFIDKGVDWLAVRPLPLAVWLVGQWLKETDLKEAIDYLNAIPGNTGNMLVRCISKRLDEMVGNTLAEEVLEKLTISGNKDFINEEVVCSDMGSRLFLSMATVNPVAIGSVVINVLSNMTVDDLRSKLKDDARRHNVMMLEKLCYVPEVAKDAVLTLAKLAVAENEKWANNSSGQLNQLFHIMLSGTVLSLKERTVIIKQLKASGVDYNEITLDILNHSFNNMSFNRDGGPEYFGTTKVEEFNPSMADIVDYWNASSDILISWIKEDSCIVERASKIALEHLNPYVGTHNLSFLVSLIDQIIETRGNHWDELYDEILRIQKIHGNLSQKDKETLNGWAQKIRPQGFIFRLKEGRRELYNTYKLSDEERLKKIDSIYAPLAKQFVENGVYSSSEELADIIFEYDFYEQVFVKYVSELLDGGMRKTLFATLKNLLKPEDEITSRFVFAICESCRDTDECKDFLSQLLSEGYIKGYVSIMAQTEGEGLENLHLIEHNIEAGILDNSALLRYLNGFNPNSEKQFLDFIEYYDEKYPELRNATMQFVMTRRFLVSKTDSEELKRAVYKLAEEYVLTPEDHNGNYEYTRFTTELLKDVPNPKAAVVLAKKFIEALNSGFYHGSLEGMLEVLLRNYPDETWEMVAEKYISKDSPYFHLQASHEVGSGSGFGRGPLFDDDDRVIELCKKHPDRAPQVLAGAIPVFNYSGNGQKSGFSRLFLFLLDEYGDNTSVLHDLHANMHTFSWVGSPIPLFEQCREFLTGLLNHKRQSVRDWAKSCIEEYEREILREKSQDEFERMHYDKGE